MNLSEWASQHPKAAYGLIGACVLLCVTWIAVQLFGSRQGIQTAAPDYYFSVDDGKTFFAAAGSNIPPFEHGGQTAVRAHVFECHGKQFVGYLDRYKPDVHKRVLAGERIPVSVELRGREVKKPGAAAWVTCDNSKAMAKVSVVGCPEGRPDTPMPVEPE